MKQLLALGALGVAACATTMAIRGEHNGKRLDLSAAATLEGNTARVSLDVNNHGDEPVGIDLDSVILQDQQGNTFLPLGRLQSFQHEGERLSHRVPNGAATVEPGTHQTEALEFEKLPAGRSFTLVVPALYRLSIDGQVPMKAIEVPLAGVTPAGTGGDGGFYDPFVQE